MMSLVYTNNFLNILLNNKDYLFIIFIAVLFTLGIAQYYDYFDVTTYAVVFFQNLFETPYLFLLPFLGCIGLCSITFKFFKNNLYLDTGLATKHAVAKTEQFIWLDQFGTLGTFLKNDIRLIKRNKRSKTTVVMSVLFLFYGLLFFSGGIEAYNSPMWHVFAGIFVTGGFLFTFGQFVPSWDSAYYQLMMTQNISYKEYLSSKWWLMVIATCISTILASMYIYFGFDIYLIIVAGAIYNIGVNSHLVLLGGAYVKTPVDLNSGKGAFGDKKAFNIKTMLITLPKLLLPMILYALGYYLISPMAGVIFVVVAGIIGFAFRNKVFSLIEKIYKKDWDSLFLLNLELINFFNNSSKNSSSQISSGPAIKIRSPLECTTPRFLEYDRPLPLSDITLICSFFKYSKDPSSELPSITITSFKELFL